MQWTFPVLRLVSTWPFMWGFGFGRACATVEYSNVNNARYKSLWRQNIIYGNLKSFSAIWRFEDHFMASRLNLEPCILCQVHKFSTSDHEWYPIDFISVYIHNVLLPVISMYERERLILSGFHKRPSRMHSHTVLHSTVKTRMCEKYMYSTVFNNLHL